MMTLQELFDTVWNGAKAQGFRHSKATNGTTCMYRGEGGLKCNAGHVLPDDQYDPKMEGCSVIGPNQAVFVGLVGRENLEALSDLQSCHDATSPDRDHENHERALRAFARNRSLTVPE